MSFEVRQIRLSVSEFNRLDFCQLSEISLRFLCLGALLLTFHLATLLAVSYMFVVCLYNICLLGLPLAYAKQRHCFILFSLEF